MISFRSLSLPMFALVAALAGCTAEQAANGQPDTSTAQQASQTQGADSEARGPHGPRGPHHGPGGPEFLIGASLHAPINLTDAQRTTIEGLLEGGRPEHREPPPVDAQKSKDLAAAIRAGNVSALPMPPAPDASKLEAHLAESATRIKTLHDTLSAEQRAKLVADLASRGEKGPPPGGPKGARGPHPGPGGEPPFAQDLALTDAQKAQLKAKMEANHPKPDFEAMRAEMTTKLESFKADSFDAAAFVAPPAKIGRPGNPLADLVSVLTPEQRETLAKKIEAGPPARPQR